MKKSNANRLVRQWLGATFVSASLMFGATLGAQDMAEAAGQSAMAGEAKEGWIVHRTSASADQVEVKYVEFLKSKGIKIFTTIDHAAAAKAAGLQMPFTKVVIFGNPKVGTMLMKKAPSLALDLPLKTLIYKSGKETVLTYRDFGKMLTTHGVKNSKVAQKIGGLLDAAAKKAIAN